MKELVFNNRDTLLDAAISNATSAASRASQEVGTISAPSRALRDVAEVLRGRLGDQAGLVGDGMMYAGGSKTFKEYDPTKTLPPDLATGTPATPPAPASGADDKTLETIIKLVSGEGTTKTPTTQATTSKVVQTSAGSAGKPGVLILFLLLAVAGAAWYFTHKKKGGGHAAASH